LEEYDTSTSRDKELAKEETNIHLFARTALLSCETLVDFNRLQGVIFQKIDVLNLIS
jgi:hypothetical protein